MNKRITEKWLVISFFLFCVSCGNVVFGVPASIKWVGGVGASGSWTDPNNWLVVADSTHRLPLATEKVLFNVEGATMIVDPNAVGASSAVSNELQGPGLLTNNTIQITGGNFNTNLLMTFGFLNTGTFIVTGGAPVVRDGFRVCSKGDGILNVSGGTLTLGALVAPFKNLVNSNNHTATVNLSGTGHIHLTANATIAIGTNGSNFTFDMRDSGTLTAVGDRTGNLQAAINLSGFTAFGGHPRAGFNLAYDAVADLTTLTAFLPDLNLAFSPTPANGAILDKQDLTTLSWKPGDTVATVGGHEVYFGTDVVALTQADSNDITGIFKGAQDANSWAIDVPLALDTAYYWRIDEVSSLGVRHTGTVWHFTVNNFLRVDDFEPASYINNAALQTVWTATTGGLPTPVLESAMTHELSQQSMKMVFTPTNFSVQRQYVSDQDWTRDNVKALAVHFAGDPANSPDLFFVKLEDANAVTATVFSVDPNALLPPFWGAVWARMDINLQSFTGVDLTRIRKISVGVGNGSSASAGGTVFIDNIRLYPQRCVAREASPADLAGLDCDITNDDLTVILDNWLASDYDVVSATPTTSLILWYPFEDVTSQSFIVDAANIDPNINYDGQVNDGTGLITGWSDSGGVIGNAINFDGTTRVSVPPSVFSFIDNEVTVSMWVFGTFTQRPLTETMRTFHATQTGVFNSVEILGPRVEGSDGAIIINTGNPTTGFDHTPWLGTQEKDVRGRWNHYAYTKNAATGVVRIYLNGTLVAENTNAFKPMAGALVDDIVISGRTGGAQKYVGKIDEFRLYDRALTQAEIVNLAGTPAGNTFTNKIDLPADIGKDGQVDLNDFAVLANVWLSQQFWP